MEKKRYKIALDCGRKTGVAIMDNLRGAVVNAVTLDFWRAHDFILDSFSPDTAEIVVEFLNPRAALYARTFNETQKGRDKFAANVGSARRETSLLIERFESKGFEVKCVQPVRKAKWTQREFELKTGLKVRTSEHARDAARLLFHG